MEPNRIVVIGGGFAGLRTAVELDKRRARLKDHSITLVDPSLEHTCLSLLYEVSTGRLRDESSLCDEELRRGSSISFDQCSKPGRRERFSFRRASVINIDQEDKNVILSDGSRLPYDDLVIAIGSEVATRGILGVSEHAIPMRTFEDALQIRENLSLLLASGKKSSIVIVGGGPVGVEIAASIAERFRGAAEVSLLEAGDSILPAYSSKTRGAVRRRLTRLGVRVRTRVTVKEVRSGSVVLADSANVSDVSADLVVWAAGIKAHSVVGEWGLPVNDQGLIKIDRSFSVQGLKNVYALGDCASLVHPRTNVRVPSLAQAASREAGFVAENIARHLERKALTMWNPPEKWFTIVPLGNAYAIMDLVRFRLCGRLPLMILKMVRLSYFLAILSPRLAWDQWVAGRYAFRQR
jgi:NADH dehydrogenase